MKTQLGVIAMFLVFMSNFAWGQDCPRDYQPIENNPLGNCFSYALISKCVKAGETFERIPSGIKRYKEVDVGTWRDQFICVINYKRPEPECGTPTATFLGSAPLDFTGRCLRSQHKQKPVGARGGEVDASVGVSDSTNAAAPVATRSGANVNDRTDTVDEAPGTSSESATCKIYLEAKATEQKRKCAGLDRMFARGTASTEANRCYREIRNLGPGQSLSYEPNFAKRGHQYPDSCQAAIFGGNVPPAENNEAAPPTSDVERATDKCKPDELECLGKIAIQYCQSQGKGDDCYDSILRYKKIQRPQSRFDDEAYRVPTDKELQSKVIACEEQSKSTLSCCGQIDQCLATSKPDQVDSAIKSIVTGATHLYVAGRENKNAKELGLAAACEKPSDAFNIGESAYGQLRARTCDEYKKKCDEACNGADQLAKLEQIYNPRACDDEASRAQNIFSKNYREGCARISGIVDHLDSFKTAKSSCGKATIEAKNSDDNSARAVANIFSNNSDVARKFREECKEQLKAQQSTGLPKLDNLIVDCRDPKSRASAQCQACLANPSLAGCETVTGLPQGQTPQASNVSGGLSGVNNLGDKLNKNRFNVQDDLPTDSEKPKIEPDAPTGLSAGTGGAAANLPSASTGGGSAGSRSRAGGNDYDTASFNLGDPQGYGAIGGSGGGYRNPASGDGGTGTGTAAGQNGGDINWNKYLPSSVQWGGRRPNGLAGAAGIYSEIYGPSKDIFEAISDRYESLCKRGQFIDACI